MASTRRLAAILAADVAGYSRLMGEDEGVHSNASRRHEGEIREVLVQRRRDRRAAVKLGRNRSGRVGQVCTILADALEPAPAERERRS